MSRENSWTFNNQGLWRIDDMFLQQTIIIEYLAWEPTHFQGRLKIELRPITKQLNPKEDPLAAPHK